MRIAYPTLWSRLSRSACREQTANTVAALARRGHEVTLLAPRGADDPVLSAADIRDWFEIDGDIHLIQHPSRWGGENLAPSLMWLRQAFAHPALLSADVILSRAPAMVVFGGLAPRPFATDQYRPWPDEFPIARLWMRRTARSANCLGLILHSDYAAQSYRRIGVPEDRLLVAHNGARPGTDDSLLDKHAARLATGLPQDRAIALYAGRINSQKGLDQILAMAARRPEVLFVMVGSERDGPVQREAAAHPNVQVVPWQTPGALRSWLAAADVLVIPPSRAPLEQYRNCVLPLKLFAYLAAGRPILAPFAPDTAEVLTDQETALLVPPGDSARATEALDRILGDPKLAARLGAAAKALSVTLTWDARASRITAFLARRLDEAGSRARHGVAANLRLAARTAAVSRSA